MVFHVYNLILIARVVLSWFPNFGNNPTFAPVALLIYRLTEPVLRPIRNVLRPYQGNVPLDFSPLLALLLLSLVEQLVLRIVAPLPL
jgi:YggT family protein